MEQTSDPGATAPAASSGLPRFVVVMLGVAATMAVLLLLHQFSSVVGPVFLAINLVIAAYPIHTWLHSKGTPGWLSATVMLLSVTVILLAAVAGLVWAVSSMVNELPNYSGQWSSLYYSVIDWLRNVGINTTGLSDMMQQISPSSLVSLLSTAFNYGTAITGVVVTIVLTLIFLAMDVPSLRERLHKPSDDYPQLARSMAHFGSSVRAYWVATTVFGAAVATLDGVALAIMGVPLPIVWAMLAFLTNYIPNIGFFIGLIPPVLLALLGSGWQLAVLVVVVYFALNTIIQTVIQPRIVGVTVGVRPTVSFISLLLWGMILGPLGTLIALPMTLLLKALFVDVDPKASWVHAIISMENEKRPKAT
ncbi:MAG: AI-2E family transporter [Propionibacteriaceae bacterium]|nr:AI-2E family transporter [Propionibacteriaceae bacterium]